MIIGSVFQTSLFVLQPLRVETRRACVRLIMKFREVFCFFLKETFPHFSTVVRQKEEEKLLSLTQCLCWREIRKDEDSGFTAGP